MSASIMKWIILLVIYCWFTILPIKADNCFQPVKEGSRYLIRQTIIPAAAVVQVEWLMIGNGGNQQSLATCNLTSCHTTDSHYIATVNSPSNVDEYEYVLTIEAVTRGYDGNTIKMEIDGTISWECSLQVFDFQSSPSCDPPFIETKEGNDPNNVYVTVNCEIFRVYPEPRCVFYPTLNAVTEPTISPEFIQEHDVTLNSFRPRYYNRQCTMSIPITGMVPANYTFVVWMYPNVTRGDGQGNSAQSSEIELVYPEPELDSCLQFVRTDTTATCQCQMKTVGNPPGQVRWMHENKPGENVTLTFTFNSNGPNPVFYCQASSPLGNGLVVDYSPEFAYGPESITEFIIPSSYNLCPKEAPLQMLCSLDKTTVYPKPNVDIIESNTSNLISANKSEETSDNYSFYFYYKPEQSVEKINLSFTCRANNIKYPDMTVELSKMISIQRPPPSPPVMSISIQGSVQNGQSVTVRNGESVDIYCNVAGGVPAVLKVNITCGGQRYEKETQSPLSLHLNKSNNNDLCVCTAEHASGCYDGNAQFTFNVLYIAEVLKFTATSHNVHGEIIKGVTNPNNNNLHQLEVDNGTKVMFACEGEGNPRPDVKIQRSNSQLFQSHVTESVDNVNVVEVENTMTCRDTGHYVCEADNLIGESSRLLLILVKCTSQLQNRDMNEVYLPLKDNTITIEIAIFGHPIPNNYLLEQVPTRTKRSVDGQEMVDSNKYEVSYRKLDELNGVVVLKMYNISDRDNGEFAFTIENGVGHGLIYNFFISERQEIAEVLMFNATSHNIHGEIMKEVANTNPENIYQLEVDNGTKVMFACEVEGNPRPDVKIHMSNSQPFQSHVTESGDNVNVIVVENTMTCRDTGHYVCEADNLIGESNRTILILVKCLSQLQNRDRNKSYSPMKDNTITIEIAIFGHPVPNNYLLEQVFTRTKRSVDVREIDSDRYDVSYRKLDELNGIVVLKMNDITDRDNGEFALTIQNGIGDGVIYNFFIAKRQESSKDSGLKTEVIIGIGIGSALLVIVIIAIFFIHRKISIHEESIYRVNPNRPLKSHTDKKTIHPQEIMIDTSK